MTAHIICCTCDLPGKALVQNILQFNGAYGCGFCEQPGKNLRTVNGGNVRIFPYQNESPNLRTAAACVKYAEDAVETNSVVSIEMCLLQLYTMIYNCLGGACTHA